MSTGTIQIPVLFDMSGDTIVFGEDGGGDFVSSHLDFLLDMTTEANDISLNAADISSAIFIGDQDDGDSIFYAGGTTGNIAVDNLCNRIANAITRGKLVHIPKSGNTSNSGIPMGGRSLLYNASGQIQDPGEYAIKYLTSIAPVGDEQMLGQAMARVASVHLVGHPLSSGIFQDATQVQTDLETASTQTFNSGESAFYNALAVQLSKVLGGSKSSTPMNLAGSPVAQVADINLNLDDLVNLTQEATLTNKAMTASTSANEELLDNNGQAGLGQGWGSGIQWADPANATTGDRVHTGSDSTTNVDGSTTLNGPWVQFDAGENVYVAHVQLYGDSRYSKSHTGRSGPRKFSILKSDDGTNWTTVKSFNFQSTVHKHGVLTDLGGINTSDYYSHVTHWYGELQGLDITFDEYFGTRYLRVHIEQSMGRNIQITECRIFGVLDASGTPITRNPTSAVCEFVPGDVTFNVAQQNICRFNGGGGIYEFNFLARPQGRNFWASNANGQGITTVIKAFNGDKTSANYGLALQGGTYGAYGGNGYQGGDGLYDGYTWISASHITNSTLDQGGEFVGIDLGTNCYGTTNSDVSNCKWVVSGSEFIGNPGYNNKVYGTRNYTIYYSHDRENWTIAKQVTKPASDNSDDAWEDDGTTYTDTFDKVIVARYWILQINATWGDSNFCSIGEWELLGQILENTTGAVGAGGSNEPPFDASGTSVPALKSIYEQLMNVPGRSQIMDTRDISGVVDNSNVTLAGGFPFIAGDKLVMYLRPKIVFSVNTSPVQFNEIVSFPQTASPSVPVYNISDSAGTISTQTYTHSSGNDWAGSMIISANGNGYLGDGNGTGTVYWNSAGGGYATNAAAGAYIGSQSTTNVDGTTTLLGEWGQIDIGVSTWATELKMTTNKSYNGRSPREFKLLGSANGTNWTSLMHKTSSDIITPWVDYVAQTFSIDSPGEYRYYKLVVIAIANNFGGQESENRTSIGHFDLRGVKYPSEVVMANTPTTQPNNQSILDISGLITNTSTVSDLFSDIFPGNATTGKEPEPNKWGWVGSANSDSFTLETTNETNNNTLDLHIWKITITL